MRALRGTGSIAELEVARAISSLKVESSQGDAPIIEHIASAEEADKKKRQIASALASPPLKKQATASMTEERKVDPSVLQFQNQKLCQQLESQKDRVQDLEKKLQGLEKKQAAYDANLITVNRIWGQLIDDLGILAVKANGSLNGSNGFTSSADERAEDPSDNKGDIFLDRLLHSCPKIEVEGDSNTQNLLERALEARSQQTVKILKCVVGGIEQQRHCNEDLQSCARQNVTDKEVLRVLEDNEAVLRDEVQRTRSAIDDLHVKHRALLAEVTLLRDVRLKQRSDMAALQEQLEDTQAELVSTKKKLVSLKQQMEAGGACSHGPLRSMSSKDLVNGEAAKAAAEELERVRGSLQEAQELAIKRLKDIEAHQEEHVDLLKKLRVTEASLRDEQRVKSTRAYTFLAEQLSASKGEVERLLGMVDGLQRDRNQWVMREKEMQSKAEAGDCARRANNLLEAQVKELEQRLKRAAEERDTLHIKVTEMKAIAARTDTVEELQGMLKTAHQEMEQLQGQIKKYKALSEEVPEVRAENQCLQEVLQRKIEECEEAKSRTRASLELVKEQEREVEAMRSKELELRLLIDMFARESLDRRELRDVKASEARALAQVEQLRAELDEHGLALRVRAANEAEAACQQRLAVAETEVTRLRDRLVDGDRRVLELEEKLKATAEDGEIYTTEIETISQAYEEMQAQNRRLLQQITERDEYNTQLMAESVKAKQLQASLKAEKEAMEAKMMHVEGTVSVDKQRAQQLEEQLKGSREQLEKALEEARKARSEVEVTKKLQGDAERESATLKRAALESEKDLGAQEKRSLELEEQLEREKHKIRRLEEEKGVLARKLQKAEREERGHSHAAVELEALQEELKEYKSTVKCSVCHDRRKEVCITKCFHLFCSPCIQRNLELRHRKCPGCGVPFGAGDVKNVYL